MIGIGAGGPEHLTLEAAAAVSALDAVVLLDKGEELDDLARLRRDVLAAHARPGLRTVAVDDPPRDLPPPGAPDYDAAVARWHDLRVDRLATTVAAELEAGGDLGLLVWGDPSLYDSTLRVLDRLAPRLPWPVDIDVLPGVSSLHLLTAAHRIPLNRVGAAVRLTTGRRLADAPPDPTCDVVVFLDGDCSFRHLDPTGIDVHWGAYLGRPDQLLVAGPLAERAEEIVRVRAEARARIGWMFDTYLLRWRG